MVKEINISDKKEKDVVEEVKDAPSIAPTTTVEKEKKKIKIPKPKKLTLILIAVAVLLLIGIALFYYFGIYKAKPYSKPSEIINLSNGYILSFKKNLSPTSVPIPKPNEPKTEVSPINGLLFTKTEIKELEKRRPVAVMINNHSDARPQSGLNSADVVFEALAESGITRFLAIFWSEAPKKVGPIRSARQYYLEWLSAYDPLFIYDGCAETKNPKTDACGNVYAYNIKKIATAGAWRWNDGKRYAPHNEYSSLFTAWEYAQSKKWDGMPDIKAWKFKGDASTDDRGQKSKVKIQFHERLSNSGMYDSVWSYDNKTNTYLKETAGRVHIDQESSAQIYAKNLVMQEVEYTPAYDDKGRIILTTIGEGDATYFIDGKVSKGRWKKNARTDRTVYYNSNNKEVEFNRGRVWISVIARSVGKFDIIEQ